MNITERNARFREVRDKVEARQRLDLEDGLFLERLDVPLQEIGQLANLVRERLNGNVAYYNINTHLNPTNVCVYRCRFCAFRKDLRDPTGYAMTDDQIIARGREATDAGCTEMHIVGGLHHQRKYQWYRGILETVKANFPQIHLKAWTGVEIDWFRFQTKKSFEWVLRDMRDAGMGSMPGGGAEIFHPEVRDQICEHKANTRNWIDIHETAHRIGMRTNCTMLYGHLEKAYHRIDHLIRLRDLQDRTGFRDEMGGFQVFIPLAFHPDNTRLDHLKKPSAIMDLRTLAIARLMLDNVRHIKAYWIMLGIETAQTALAYGADDLDGTVRHELIYHDAGSQSPEYLPVNRIRELIVEAGRQPVERDTTYHRVERDADDFTRWHAAESVDAELLPA